LDRSDLRSIYRFGVAYAIVAVLASLQNRVGVFLLKKLTAVPGEVADYTLAFHLTAVFLFLLGAYYNVMFSKISSIREWKEVLRVQVKSILPLSLLAAAAGILILSAGFIIPMILPPKYSGTVPAARWLLLSVVFIAMGMPAGMVLLHAKRLAVVAASYAVGLGAMVAMAHSWVPRWGAPGMAAANCCMIALVNVSLVAYTLLSIRRGGSLGGGASSP
jgi:O-antigen/teichoic acid export membrane protein